MFFLDRLVKWIAKYFRRQLTKRKWLCNWQFWADELPKIKILIFSFEFSCKNWKSHSGFTSLENSQKMDFSTVCLRIKEHQIPRILLSVCVGVVVIFTSLVSFRNLLGCFLKTWISCLTHFFWNLSFSRKEKKRLAANHTWNKWSCAWSEVWIFLHDL